jgi:hypothetical protein
MEDKLKELAKAYIISLPQQLSGETGYPRKVREDSSIFALIFQI